jgi:thioredoxin 1
MLNKHRPISVFDKNFQKIVFETDKPVLVDFWAEWCGPCKRMSPVLGQIAQEQAGALTIVKAHLEDVPEWAQKFGITSIPALVMVTRGRVRGKVAGFGGEEHLRTVVKRFLVEAPQLTLGERWERWLTQWQTRWGRS